MDLFNIRREPFLNIHYEESQVSVVESRAEEERVIFIIDYSVDYFHMQSINPLVSVKSDNNEKRPSPVPSSLTTS